MYTVKAAIEGLVPIKLNHITEYEKKCLVEGTKVDPKVQQKDWINKVLRDKKGCYVESYVVRASIINGLALPIPFASNRVKLHKKKGKATVFVNPAKVYLNKEPQKKPDITLVPTSFGLARQLRPIIEEGWTLSFEITIVDDFLLHTVLRQGVARAGLCHGIGSHRPDFGRFKIKEWEVSKEEEE